MKPKPSNISKSQYPGTCKDSVCKKCGKHLNNLTRVQQDGHAEQHRKDDIESGKQTTLI